MKVNPYEQEHLNILRPYLSECAVLLKKNGDFPLEKPCEIAAYGSGVRHTVKGGTGSGEVNSPHFINIEEGLENAGFTLTSQNWLKHYERHYEKARAMHFLTLKKDARKKRTLAVVEGMGRTVREPEYYIPFDAEGDTAIYVIRRICGEGGDRSEEDIRLTDTEIRDILTVNHQYKKFILVINSGGYIDLTPVKDVDNILLLSQLGTETGAVLADILLGKAYPSGRLSASWAKAEDYYQDNGFGEWDDVRYREGIYTGYRYFDSFRKEVLYPFCYGLGYTDFEITPLNYEQKGEELLYTCMVKNTGAFRGKETVQLYVTPPGPDQPYQVLAAFAKTEELKPEETQQLTLHFLLRGLSVYDTVTQCYVLKKGDYLLRIGSSSRNTQLAGAFHISEDHCVQKAVNILSLPDFIDLTSESTVNEIPSSMISIDLSLIKEQQLQEMNTDIPDSFRDLDEETLAAMNIGAYGMGLTDIIGNAAKQVAGAAGETAYFPEEYGYPLLVMADGPAGLRLSRNYFEDKKGKVHALGSVFPETVGELLPKGIVRAADTFKPKPRKKDIVHEQNATALPIGTAIAQSWNLEFAELCGDIIGREMEVFHVDLWLAPALNIQRDVRCGRNFEYFSEDPLVSGLFAAAITKGVQKHPGKGVTLKHFCANSQETNRYNSNSVLSERALREIYLRGFEIAIRESHPYAVMTSYNLLNGIHTSEHSGLLIDVLRRQFGFDGIVMTDWVTAGFLFSRQSKYPVPDAAKVAAASNDLFMPGSDREKKEILKGLKEGRVTKEQLAANASRVARTAVKMRQNALK